MKIKTPLHEDGSLRTIQPGRRVATLLLLLLALAIPPASAATLRWTGGHGSSSDWSRGANWDTGTAPANDDILVFPAGAARLTNNNDLTGLRVATIRFIGATAGYTLSGNAVTVTDDITANHAAGANTIALARVTLANAMSFTVAQTAVSLVIDSEVRLNGNDLTANATGFLVLRGVISGTGNVNKMGDGLLTLSGAAGNTFTGNLFANAGVVFLGKTAGLAVTNRLVIGDGVGGAQADSVALVADNQVNEVTINSSGLWSLSDFKNEVSDLVLNQGGDVMTSATGKLRLGAGGDITVAPATDPTPNISSLSGNLELSAGMHVITVGENTASASDESELVIDAIISGTALSGITKEGAGDLELSGNNTFGGQVIVNAGELRVGHASALGATGTLAPTTANNAATVRVMGNVDVGAEVLRLDSTGVTSGGGNHDAVLRTLGTASWAGDITLLRDTRIGVAPNGQLTLRGVIGGTGNITKENTGTLSLSGNNPNTFNGDLFVSAGTVELDKGTIGGVVAVPGRLIIGDGLGGTDADVARHRKDNQVNTVTINGSGLWDLGVFQEEVSDLDLNDGGEVTTAATGLLRLGIGANVSANKTISGPDSLAIISGNLELLLGTHTLTVTKEVGVSGGSLLSIGAHVSGSGAITKEGSGVLLLQSANTFAGLLTVNAGQLVAYDPQALGDTISGTRINAGTTFEMVFDGTVAGESLTLDGSTILCVRHGVWTGDVTLLGDSTINAGAHSAFDSSFEVRGVVSGSGGLTKIGQAPLTFSGNAANSYSGVTIVNESRLVLNKTGANVAVPGALVIGDGLGGTDADVVECLGVNEIGALSAVTVNSSGQLIVGQESIGALAGSGNVLIINSLTAGDANTTALYDGVISGATGSFNKHGTGTLTFNGNNTYLGGTGIAEGTLIVNGQQPASSVLLQPTGRLGGSGRVGNLSMFAGGAVVAPGSSPGRLTAGNVAFTPGTVFRVDLEGPMAGTQHDQLRVLGTVDLGQAELNVSLAFTPTLGQSCVIIDNDGTDAIIDRFAGLPEGDTLRLNQIPFIISYRGGDGNDVTLTATNKSISVVSARIEAGNGNGVIDPNECNHLFVALMNETTDLLAVSRVVLDPATPGVIVTQQKSDYANFPALGFRTNSPPFQFRTTPNFECGQLVEFLLTLTVSGSGTFTIPFAVPSGSGGAPVRFDNGANLALVDNGPTTSTLPVTGAAPHVGQVTVSLHITHPSAGDLVLRLRSPSGTTVRLANQLGGTTDNYGAGCGDANRTTFDDAAPLRIAAGTAPFVGSFTPEEPLAAFLGEDPNGDWQLLIQDTLAGDTGELRCWSLLISPPECSDGGGSCESCVPALTGRFTADMPSTTTRLVRNGLPSGCGSPKACPTVTTGPRLFYRVHLITNSGPETCVSAVLADLCRASNLRLHCAAYLGSYDPANPCANYLGDTGNELTAGSTGFSFTAPPDAVIALVVSSPVSATACVSAYLVQLHGLPCPPPTLHIAPTGNPEEVRLFWSTAYPDFDLQRTPTLNGPPPSPFVNVPFMPIVVNGDYSVTNRTTAPPAYYRLRKP